MWNDEVILLTYPRPKLDALMQEIEQEPTEETISCNVLNIKSSEFYFATQNNLKLELKLEIHEFEYSNQEFLIFKNVKYKIIRTYRTTNELLEITCERALES